MCVSFKQMFFRRASSLAFFIFVILFFSGQGLFAQLYVTNNGIIMEKLPDEDVQEVERLNHEAELEDELEREKELSETEAFDLDDVENADEIDDLFGEDAEGDVEAPVTTPTTEIVKVDAKNKPVEFSGNLSAELGGLAWFYPWEDTKPVATFSNTLKFIGRPRSDFYVYGSFLTQFPSMDFGIYELFFDYTILGLVDLSAGKRDISWSHSRNLHTNLIDYQSGTVDGSKILNPDKRTTDDSRFTLSISVPVLSYGSIHTIAQYQSRVLEEEIPDYISMDAKIEANVRHFSFALLAKRWAKQDSRRYDPCFGGEVVSTILGKDSNLFAQGLFHIGFGSKRLTRARGTVGIYKYFENPIMLGLSFEYQCVWDKSENEYNATDSNGNAVAWDSTKNYGALQHLFAAEIFWSRFIFTKKWTFGGKWFHDYHNDYGIITPGITVETILPYVDFKTTAPIYYGSQQKYGLVFEIVLNLTY